MKKLIILIVLCVYYCTINAQVYDNNCVPNPAVYSSSIGESTTANGITAFSSGHTTNADGDYSTVFGQNTNAQGGWSLAAGYNCIAQSDYSISFGQNNNSNGRWSFTHGTSCTTSADFSFAYGNSSSANGNYSYVFGEESHSNGNHSFALGNLLTVDGDYSLAVGGQCWIVGNNSFASGFNNNVNGSYSGCFGENNTVEGNWDFASGKNCVSDNNSVAMGNTASATGVTSFAFGDNIIVGGNNSYSFGSSNYISGSNSMSFGSALEISYPTNNSILFGSGVAGYSLTGKSNSFIVGFISNIPTFIVHESSGAYTSGKVGIGTGYATPDAKFEVADYQSVLDAKIAKFKDSENRQLFIIPKLSASGQFSPMGKADDIAILFSDNISYDISAGLIIAPYLEGGGIRIDKYGNVGINTSSYILDGNNVKKNVGNNSSFQVNGGTALGYNTPTEVPVDGLLVSGVVGINTNTTDLSTLPSACKLAVNGTIYATEMWVQEYTDWPDYVFNNNYNLMPLSELENYIKTYNHLPDVPSKDKVSEDGINVGEMNEILLKKIEELTLYIIELST